MRIIVGYNTTSHYKEFVVTKKREVCFRENERTK